MKTWRSASILCIISIMPLLFDVKQALCENAFVYDSKNKRDPFIPLVSNTGEFISESPAVISSANINVEGIIWDPAGTSVAIINGSIVKEGDAIDTITIKKIGENYVTILTEDNEEKTIPLSKEGGEDVKKAKEGK